MRKIGSLVLILAASALILAIGGSARADTIMINNGLAPPNPANVIDDYTYTEDSVYVRNAGCPPGWPSGVGSDPCPSPGASTEVEVATGALVPHLVTYDSSTVTMNGGTVMALYAYDASTITMEAGNVDSSLHAYDASNITMNGGHIESGLAALGSNDITINDGIVNTLGASGTSTVTINGGLVNHVVSSSEGAVTLNGGSYTRVGTRGSSTLTIKGGGLENTWLQAYDSSTIRVSGGTIQNPWDVDGFYAYDSSEIWVIGYDFAVDGIPVPYGELAALSGWLTGTLASGDSIYTFFSRGGGSYTGTIRLVQPPPRIEVYNTDLSPDEGFVKVLEEGDILSRAEVGSCPGFHTVTTGARDDSSPESLEGEFTHPGGVEHYNETNQPYCWPLDQGWYDMEAGIPNCLCRDDRTSADGNYSITVTPYDGKLVGGWPTGSPGTGLTISFSITSPSTAVPSLTPTGAAVLGGLLLAFGLIALAAGRWRR